MKLQVTLEGLRKFSPSAKILRGQATGLVSATQGDQTENPSRNETGLDASHNIHVSSEGEEEKFSLDILFHRMSAMTT
jgi:hypothetical protein